MKQMSFRFLKQLQDGTSVDVGRVFTLPNLSASFSEAAILAEFVKFLGTLKVDGDVTSPEPPVPEKKGPPDLKVVE